MTDFHIIVKQAFSTQPAGQIAMQLYRLLVLPMVWQERSWHRRHLRTLDERLIRDVGLTRRDIEREARKPFWVR